MTRKTYHSDGAISVGPYSHAVESGDLIYFSGQTPIDSQTGNWSKVILSYKLSNASKIYCASLVKLV